MKRFRWLAWPWLKQEWSIKKRAWIAVPIYLFLFVMIVGSSEETPPEATKAKAKPKASSAPSKKSAPKKTLQQSLKVAAREEVGKKNVKSVRCEPDGKDTLCTVEYRLGPMWDADDDEVARDVGDMTNRLFKDTKVQYLRVTALTDTTDNLGNETKDDDVAWIIIRRAGWNKLTWKNLRFREPTEGLRSVSEVYADTLR